MLKTLVHTIVLDTGTWTIDIVHREATTHVYMPRHAVREQMPVDPWSDIAPLATRSDGVPLYAPTMVLKGWR
jgi:hypothetical protein